MPDDRALLEASTNTFGQILPPVQAALFFILLTAVSVWDISERKIPDGLQVGIAALSLLQFEPQNIQGILTAVLYFSAALGCQTGRGIGGGDVKLAGALGLVLGLSGGLFASVISLTGFVLYGMGVQMYRKFRKKETQAPLPLGPFLAARAAAIYLMKVGGRIL